MRQTPVIITLGIIQIIILTLFGIYFYRLKRVAPPSASIAPVSLPENGEKPAPPSLQGDSVRSEGALQPL